MRLCTWCHIHFHLRCCLKSAGGFCSYCGFTLERLGIGERQAGQRAPPLSAPLSAPLSVSLSASLSASLPALLSGPLPVPLSAPLPAALPAALPAPLPAPLSVPINGHYLPPIQPHSAAMDQRSMHYFSKRHRRSDRSEGRFYSLQIDCHFRCLGQGQTGRAAIQFWVVIGCHLPNAVACRIGVLPREH